MLRASDVDPVLAKYCDAIHDWGYKSSPLQEMEGRQNSDKTKISDLARIANDTIEIMGLSPSSLFDHSIPKAYSDSDISLGLTEQLYTARGSQGFGTYKDIRSFGVDPSEYTEVLGLIDSVPNVG